MTKNILIGGLLFAVIVVVLIHYFNTKKLNDAKAITDAALKLSDQRLKNCIAATGYDAKLATSGRG